MKFKAKVTGRNIEIPLEINIEKIHGKLCIIDVRKEIHNRSNKQNAFYWGVVVPKILSRAKELTGEDIGSEDIHLYIKSKIMKLEFEIVNVLGEQLVKTKEKSTKQLTTEEFNVLIAKIQEHFAHLDIDIPDPNEHLEMPL